MLSHIHLDPVGGVAGDMFIASLIDAWPDLQADLVAAIHSVEVLNSIRVHIWRDSDSVLSGYRFKVQEDVPAAGSGHRHTRFRDIREILSASKLTRRVAERAEEIFKLLAEAEASVHGTEVDDVAFHEVGAVDSIADIVGAAYLIETLGGRT